MTHYIMAVVNDVQMSLAREKRLADARADIHWILGDYFFVDVYRSRLSYAYEVRLERSRLWSSSSEL